MDLAHRRCTAADADRLVRFLTAGPWPHHAEPRPDEAAIRARLADGHYDNDDHRTYWITDGCQDAGLIRLMDLRDPTPMFDLRVAAAHRGRGVGTRAVTWLTAYVFGTFPSIRRIEGTTRRDNTAMRRVFQRCGYVKEAHYRQAWPGADGTFHDAVGYAVLRRDWESGTTTRPDWDDEPGRHGY